MGAKGKTNTKPKGVRYKVKDYANALEVAQGYQAAAAQLLGVSPSAVTMMIKRHPSLGKLQKRLEEDRRLPVLDMGESKLAEAVRDGKAWAIKYYLNNHGGDRGFGKKLHLSGKLDSEISEADPLKKFKEMPADKRRREIMELLQRVKTAGGDL
jgi:hypothetical protein